MWFNKGLCLLAFGKYIFEGILHKLKYSRYFAIREVTIATYKRSLLDGKEKSKKKRKKLKNQIAPQDPNQINNNASNNNNNGNKLNQIKENKKKRKIDERSKLERKMRGYLSLRTFTYDATRIFPWICVYLSVQCAASSTYYIKTFASTSFYQALSKQKHEKNRFMLKIFAVTTLMVGICCGIGNDTYLESVKYAKRWFMSNDQYSIESYQSRKKAKQLLIQDQQIEIKKKLSIINESNENENDDNINLCDITPGGNGNINGDELKDEEIDDLIKNQSNGSMDRNTSINSCTTDEESDQIEGEGINNSSKTKKRSSKTTKYTLLQERLINGNYQQETDMLLSSKYFHQKAHDIFEYVTEICVFLEDHFLNSLIIPVY